MGLFIFSSRLHVDVDDAHGVVFQLLLDGLSVRLGGFLVQVSAVPKFHEILNEGSFVFSLKLRDRVFEVCVGEFGNTAHASIGTYACDGCTAQRHSYGGGDGLDHSVYGVADDFSRRVGALAKDILVDVSHCLLKAFLQNLRCSGFRYLLAGIDSRLLGNSASACADEGFYSRFVPDDSQSGGRAQCFRNTVQCHV